MHYSGHGGSAKDKTGDEDDGKDETMIPVDYKTSGQIKDDEILKEVRNTRCDTRGCALVCVLSFCFPLFCLSDGRWVGRWPFRAFPFLRWSLAFCSSSSSCSRAGTLCRACMRAWSPSYPPALSAYFFVAASAPEVISLQSFSHFFFASFASRTAPHRSWSCPSRRAWCCPW